MERQWLRCLQYKQGIFNFNGNFYLLTAILIRLNKGAKILNGRLRGTKLDQEDLQQYQRGGGSLKMFYYIDKHNMTNGSTLLKRDNEWSHT